MTDEFSLLCAIADSPEEDTPRLMYADFLDEFHPDRAVLAQHIRAMVRLSKGAAGRFLGRLPDAVLAKYKTWTAARKLCEVRGGSGIDAWTHKFGEDDWYRGLPYRIGTFLGGGSYWLDVGPTIVRRAPVSEVVVGDKKPSSHGTVTCPEYLWFQKTLTVVAGGQKSPATLPDCIFDHLSGYVRKTAGIAVYSSAILANDALSKACIAWARATDPNHPRESSDAHVPTAAVPPSQTSQSP